MPKTTSDFSKNAETSERMDPGKNMKDEADKLRILSIDGGGVRGVIPAAILKYLEEQLREKEKDKPKDIRLADYFDLIVGTSTGGLITAMITTPRPKEYDPQEQPFSAIEVVEFYKEYAAQIFPPARGIRQKVRRKVGELRRPRFSPKELNIRLKKYFDKRTLSEAITNVIIPSFDINLQLPVFFSSWEGELKAALVKDVCRATTAAPTFLPPVYFTVPSTEDTDDDTEVASTWDVVDKQQTVVDKQETVEKEKKEDPQSQAGNKTRHFNMIDGGIAANNPTHVGITKAIQYTGDNPIVDQADKSSFKKLLVLSLGTGRHRTGYLAKDAKKWGVIQWLRHEGDTPLISSLQNASADMVDYNLSIIFKAHESPENYIRLQVDIPDDETALARLDNAEEGNLEALEALEKELLEKRVYELNFDTGNLDRDAKDNTTFKKALERFATELVSLRKMRVPQRWAA